MLHIGLGPSIFEEQNGPPLVVANAARVMLTDDIWIERLEEQLAKNIQRACEPPHYNISVVAQDRHLYAFVRNVPASEKSNHEGMDDLFATAALSRLVHPTSIAGRYCAKVFHFGHKDSPIQALQFRGVSPDVFVSGGQRDWLSVDDAALLRSLMAWAAKDRKMYARVHRAYWNHEYAMRSLYADARWIFVVADSKH
jgi:hypothetical protein